MGRFQQAAPRATRPGLKRSVVSTAYLLLLEGVEFVCILREYPDTTVVFLTFDLNQASKLRIPNVSGEGMK